VAQPLDNRLGFRYLGIADSCTNVPPCPGVLMKRSETLQIELERRLLHGLRLEWENACGHLSEELATRMKPPCFSLGKCQHPDLCLRTG
jgi:hypothetical protein